MTEISTTDVQTYTKGRLSSSDPEVARMLAAALAVARREVGWHVSPVRTAHAFTMDGPDSRILWLPTLKVVTLTNVTESDVVLAPTAYSLSMGDGPGLPRRAALRKTGASYWGAEYGSIDIVMDHGFTEAEAADWRQAILSLVDQMSLVPVSAGTGVSDFGLSGKRVDDVDYRYNAYAALAEDVIFSVCNILDDYKINDLEFF